MKYKMLRRDITRNKVITATLFLFITLAALLISCAVFLFTEMLGAMDTLFEEAEAPHFVQMHKGAPDQAQIDAFAASNPMVTNQQTVEMLNVPGYMIALGSVETEADSVMEIAFVTQNEGFDYLTDVNGGVAQVAPREVGVPVYYIDQNNLQIGDTVRILDGDFTLELTISCFIRDAQMNPSVVTSKRFLVSDVDWETIKAVSSSEYLIEFQLTDPGLAGDFEQAYLQAGLPQSDTTITYTLYKLMNGLTDGLVAAVIILIGLLLVVISLLCLRYTILATFEEDTREIGVMKAIGLPDKRISGIYLTKYMTMAAAASIVGYLLSIPVRGVFTASIALYMGSASKTVWTYLIPLLAAGAVFLLILAMIRLVLRKLRRMSAVEALRARNDVGVRKTKGGTLSKSRLGTAPWLALRDIRLQWKSYILLAVVFIICTFLAVTPVNLYTTVDSPQFVTYMGVGSCDLRIDIQGTEDMQGQAETILTTLSQDNEVSRYAAYVTGTFQAQDAEGGWALIKVETGDYSVFPLDYAEGHAPQNKGEIALSTMNADELGKAVGDTLVVMVDEVETPLTVCGLYQDVTNGGKTAKALLTVMPENTLWYTINVDVAEGVDTLAKKDTLAAQFQPARVLDMEDYLNQTLGAVTSQLGLAAVSALVVAVAISILITAMFFKMMLAKDASQTAIMQSLGFGSRSLRLQYVLRAMLVLLVGIVVGTVLANDLGADLAGLLLSSMGADNIRFIVNPLLSYGLCPVLLILSVSITVMAGSGSLNKPAHLRLEME